VKVLVRPPAESFRLALSDHPERDRIDPGLALQQHGAFVTALREAGAQLIELPPEPDLPDAPFVSDTVIALAPPGGREAALLVVCRPGAPSRRPEVSSVLACARVLAPQVTLVEIEEPGTLEGGDVVVFGERIVIGLSARTNEAGARRLADAAAALGYRPFLCPVGDRLHLASAVTAIGSNRLIGTEAGLASVGEAARGVERLVVPDEELPAANVLSLSDHCFVAAGHPRSAKVLRDAGQRVVEIGLGEFTKADGGPTCLVALIP
jgi:dimethylargininase